MKIKNALLLIDNMSGIPYQSDRAKIEPSFITGSFRELNKLIDDILYNSFKRKPSERKVIFDKNYCTLYIYIIIMKIKALVNTKLILHVSL